MKKFSRKVRYGSMSTVILVVFLAVVVVVNLLVSLLINRFPLTLDLTEDGIYQLGEESISVLDELSQDVQITVLLDESELEGAGSYFLQAHEMLNQYRQHSPHVTVKYMSYYENPNLATLYSEYTLSQGDILVESGEKTRHYALSDLFNQTTDYYTGSSTVSSSKVEEVITSAIMQVTDANPVTVIVLTGHGETEPTTFMELLTLNGYEVVTRNIMTDELDENASMVIMNAPSTDYNAAELEKLDTFLNGGGTLSRQLMVTAGLVYTDLPRLDEFLEEWGISIDSGCLYETDSDRVYGDAHLYLDVPDSDSEYLTGVRNPSYPLISIYTHPIYRLFETRASYETESILSTSETSVVQPEDALTAEGWTPDTSTAQSYDNMVLSRKTAYVGIDVYESVVVALGSNEFIGDVGLSTDGANNNAFMLNLVNTLTGKEEGLSLLPKSSLGTTVGISDTWVQRFMIFFVVIVPVAVLIAGLGVFIRRRHR